MNHDCKLPENYLAGAVGALLFALAGGVIYFVLYQIGFVAALSGLIGVICAVKGYEIFSGRKQTLHGTVIASVMALVVLTAAWYFCLGFELYKAVGDWYEAGEITEKITFFEAFQFLPLYFEDSEFLLAALKELGLGLFFGAGGMISTISTAVKAKKAAEAAPAEATVILNGDEVPMEEAAPADPTDSAEG